VYASTGGDDSYQGGGCGGLKRVHTFAHPRDHRSTPFSSRFVPKSQHADFLLSFAHVGLGPWVKPLDCADPIRHELAKPLLHLSFEAVDREAASCQ